MELVTYDLTIDNDYYDTIKYFTEEMLNESSNYLNNFIDDYIVYNPINKNEAILEFLLLGIYWNCYISKAINLESDAEKVLTRLSKMRNNYPNMKEDIDYIKGYLSTMFLYKNNISNANANISLKNLEKLIGWLKSSGEYNEELNHMNSIVSFLKNKTNNKFKEIMNNILLFSEYFTKRSEEVLGKYTVNVNNFIENKISSHINKEDIIFCSQLTILYHVNMFGAEVMNQIFKEKFKERKRKAILVPGCMRCKQDGTCKSHEERLGNVCSNCCDNCNISSLTKKGVKEGFEVYIISHESTAFKNANKNDQTELGIIGVACVLNLISGGWKSSRLNIPAQCVILNHVGCANHWINNTIYPTNINIFELNHILTERLL